jgi:hypothetical protein
MKRGINVTVQLTVYDERAFRAAAQQRALDDGLSPKEAKTYLSKTKQSLGECAQMLIDPGVSPDGCSIEGSDSEEWSVQA